MDPTTFKSPPGKNKPTKGGTSKNSSAEKALSKVEAILDKQLGLQTGKSSAADTKYAKQVEGLQLKQVQDAEAFMDSVRSDLRSMKKLKRVVDRSIAKLQLEQVTIEDEDKLEEAVEESADLAKALKRKEVLLRSLEQKQDALVNEYAPGRADADGDSSSSNS